MSETVVQIPLRAFLPRYRHILADYPNFDIDFLYGGRDSGKSRFVCQLLVMECLNAKYFRCILARKVFNTIKDSTFQMIKDVVESWGLEELFDFKTHPLEIHCVNGNKFICRGFDDPGKIRSVSNPSHAFVDEGNQLTSEDFLTLLTSLRTDEPIKVFFAFNPEAEGNYEDFWLYKEWFSHTGELSWTHTFEIKVPGGPAARIVKMKCRATHSTYHDNRFCTPQRQAFLERLAVTSPFYYQVFTLGLWGNKENDSPFAYAYDATKHVGTVQEIPGIPITLVFDFNRNPIVCGVYQKTGHTSAHCIESIKLPNSDIYRLCDYIQTHYPNRVFIVGGDATGQNSTALVRDNINYYTVIKTKLRLGIHQIKVPTVNPKIEENQLLVNTFLALCDFKLDAEKARPLKFDLENVRMLASGEIDKSNRTDPTKQADSLDHFRYFLNTFFPYVLKMDLTLKKGA